MNASIGLDVRLQVYLNAGELHIAHEPTLVVTLLGSCVAVSFFHPKSQSGALCHGLLPSCRCDDGCLDLKCADCFRFVDCSIFHMLHYFEDEQGVSRTQLQVKLFGGSDMFDPVRGVDSVGRQNIRIAREVIQKERLVLSAQDVGGDRGRKIFFYTHTGQVLLKRLKKSDPATLNALSSRSPPPERE